MSYSAEINGYSAKGMLTEKAGRISGKISFQVLPPDLLEQSKKGEPCIFEGMIRSKGLTISRKIEVYLEGLASIGPGSRISVIVVDRAYRDWKNAILSRAEELVKDAPLSQRYSDILDNNGRLIRKK